MRVTLYSRVGCHLCDDTRAELQALAAERGDLELIEVDIESDDELLRSFLERIPVVEVGGRVVSELVFNRDAFIGALHTVEP